MGTPQGVLREERGHPNCVFLAPKEHLWSSLKVLCVRQQIRAHSAPWRLERTETPEEGNCFGEGGAGEQLPLPDCQAQYEDLIGGFFSRSAL